MEKGCINNHISHKKVYHKKIEPQGSVAQRLMLDEMNTIYIDKLQAMVEKKYNLT